MIKLPLAIVPIAAELAFLLLHRESRGRLGGWLRTAAWVFPLGLLWHAANAVTYWEEARLVFERMAGQAAGGVIHFGFRLVKPVDVSVLRQAVEAAGGKVKDAGEFEPGAPYLFFDDPDGYEVEVWFEKV